MTMSHTDLSVTGMTCGGCEKSIERVLGELPGVSQVNANKDANTVSIDFDPAAVSVEQLATAVEDAGFDVTPASD